LVNWTERPLGWLESFRAWRWRRSRGVRCEFRPPCPLRFTDPWTWPTIESDGPSIGKRAAARYPEQRIWVESSQWEKHSPGEQLAMLATMKAWNEGATCDACRNARSREIVRLLLELDDAGVELIFAELNKGRR
jgi:hypothetical protein